MRSLRFISLAAIATIPVAFGCSAGDKNRNNENPGTLNPDTGVEGGLVISDGATGPEIGIFSAVTITPSNPVIAIDTATTPPTAGSTTFVIRVRNEDGTETDVSSVATLKIDPRFGSFAGPEFTSATALPDGKPSSTVFTAEVKDKDGKGKTGEAQITLIALRNSGEKRDFFFIEPYLGAPSPSRDVLKFGTNIKQVDVAYTVDTTGSMGGVITNIKTNIASTIPKLKLAIPNVGVAVSGYDDFPYDGHGSGPDAPFYLLQTVTTSVVAAQAGANALVTHNGDDGPESQYEAVYQILTGEGVNWPGGTLKKKTNTPGTYGYVDFRPGSLPVVVNATDIEFHPKSDYRIDATTPAPLPHGRDEVIAAYKKTYARHVAISTGASAYPQQEELSKESGSYVPPSAFKGACGAGQCCTNESGAGRAPDGPGGTCLLAFRASYSGTGVSDGIVSAIAALSAGTNFDVTAAPSNNPANPGGVDATKFIKAIRAMDEGDEKQGCPPVTAKDTNGDGIKDTFSGVGVGTPVCFEVIPEKNTFVEPTKGPQFFNAFITVLGVPGAVKLDEREVQFYVPPKEIIAK